ncbi:MAG: hypothetical protein HY905_04265 [Deltaproteobacteria bacterium]|nr:hypothetical protein [Deltaproteobacteria bacterium]
MSRALPLLPFVVLTAVGCSGTGTTADDVAGDTDLAAEDDGGGADAAEDRTGPDHVRDGPIEARDFSREDAASSDATIPESTPLPPTCGDGVVDPGEECDDGNRLNDDGCDWLCRILTEPFVYPPPGPDATPATPTGPPAEVTEGAEMASGAAFAVPDLCSPVWLAAGGGGFAVAYDYDQPYYGVRVRILDRTGRTIGAPWDHETPWHLFSQALFATGEGFGLFSGHYSYGLLRTRIGADGTVPEEFNFLRGPIGPVAGLLTGGAWSPGRWLAVAYVSTGSASDYRAWLLETFSDDGTPIRSVAASRPPGGDEAGCVTVVPTDAGFAASDGISVVVFDADLNPVSWSGTIAPWQHGASSLSADRYWLAWSAFREGGVWPGDRDIVVVAVGPEGTPLYPPRTIVEASPEAVASGWGCCGNQPHLAVAAGPTGAAIVYWEGLPDEETYGGPVMLLTVDDWGNVITPPTPVLAAGEITTIGWVLAVTADDDLGYGVVTMVPGDVLGTASLVFRHFAPAP